MVKKRDLFVFFLTLSSFLSLHAQVGINTEKPDASAYLDIDGKSRGVLFPLLKTSDRDVLVLPATGLIILNTDKALLEQNIGTPEKPVWGTYSMGSSEENKSPSWFYMPVTPIDVSLADNLYKKDLYQAYLKQFTNATLPNVTPKLEVPKIYEVGDLEFVVLGYDKSVFSNVSISNVGVLEYKANPANVSDSTYFNVIFKIK